MLMFRITGVRLSISGPSIIRALVLLGSAGFGIDIVFTPSELGLDTSRPESP
jgi:hypothetical protein